MDLHPDVALAPAEAGTGTRFWIFPQPPFIPGYEQPDRVWLSILPDQINEGPSDALMYVADPLYSKQPYGMSRLPPFEGIRRPPVQAGPDRHFDGLDPRSRPYLGVHAYACIHRVLDIWQSYIGHPIRWFFDGTIPKLEIVPFVEWDNAQAGYGFLELGCSHAGGSPRPYALNFDAIAHELGHLIIFSEMGVPLGASRESDFFPFSEGFSDCVSLISFLHFDSAIDRLLRRTRGNLLLYNELNRFAETSPETQIRLATNFRRMSEVTREPHDRALPFVGAVFDSIIDLYHRNLVEHGCADRRLLDVDLRELTLDEFDRFRELTTQSFLARPLFFKLALMTARDEIGRALAGSLKKLDSTNLTFHRATRAILDSAEEETAARLEENFTWRGFIDPRGS
ncbi:MULTISPECIES: hypothetical protein [Rhizobium]|uniref:Peptidase M4 C-terminal domain-containing protein n=1 Tax=Rhizobium favelukesii TaxID=348824 RepID=W6RQI2_9HYPH|nr:MULTISPECIES: hypothetical protein [Rhizobium]MCS0462634.1 hypothetical protein [Rhizobium favelukesii]UFS79397.1 hypothetical protein LPB79_07355 [Rhizobium sp. T136]CDM62954.1 hypothetical protein LPU83_pLPU83d_1584 [Rhizobium favelukesii]